VGAVSLITAWRLVRAKAPGGFQCGWGLSSGIESLLDTRISSQLEIPILGRVNRFIGTPDHPIRRIGRSAILARPFPHHTDIALDDRLVEAFALFIAHVDRQLVALYFKTRIDHHNLSGKNADGFRRVEDNLIGINFGDDLLPRSGRGLFLLLGLLRRSFFRRAGWSGF